LHNYGVPGRPPDPPHVPQQIIEDQTREIDRLREDLRRSEAERQRLRRENEKLKEELEAARRAVYRQAAPFSRGTRVAQPRRPGRKAGSAYGTPAQRQPPSHVDVICEAPLPPCCPRCRLPHCCGHLRIPMPPLFSSSRADRQKPWHGFGPSVTDSSSVLASLCSPA
jgi:hypothetical protein